MGVNISNAQAVLGGSAAQQAQIEQLSKPLEFSRQQLSSGMSGLLQRQQAAAQQTANVAQAQQQYKETQKVTSQIDSYNQEIKDWNDAQLWADRIANNTSNVPFGISNLPSNIQGKVRQIMEGYYAQDRVDALNEKLTNIKTPEEFKSSFTPQQQSQLLGSGAISFTSGTTPTTFKDTLGQTYSPFQTSQASTSNLPLLTVIKTPSILQQYQSQVASDKANLPNWGKWIAYPQAAFKVAEGKFASGLDIFGQKTAMAGGSPIFNLEQSEAVSQAAPYFIPGVAEVKLLTSGGYAIAAKDTTIPQKILGGVSVGLGALGAGLSIKGLYDTSQINKALENQNIFISGTIKGDTAELIGKSKVLDKEFTSISQQKLLQGDEIGAISSVGREATFLTSPKDVSVRVNKIISINKELGTANKVTDSLLFANPSNLLDSSMAVKSVQPIDNVVSVVGRSFTKPVAEAEISLAKVRSQGLLDTAGESKMNILFGGATSKNVMTNAPVESGSFAAMYKPLSDEATANLKSATELSLENARNKGELFKELKDLSTDEYFGLLGTSKPVLRIYKEGGTSIIIKNPNIKGIIKVEGAKVGESTDNILGLQKPEGDIYQASLNRLKQAQTGENIKNLLLVQNKKGQLGSLELGNMVSSLKAQAAETFAPKLETAGNLFQIGKSISKAGVTSLGLESTQKVNMDMGLLLNTKQDLLMKQDLKQNLDQVQLLKQDLSMKMDLTQQQDLLQNQALKLDLLQNQGLQQEQVSQMRLEQSQTPKNMPKEDLIDLTLTSEDIKRKRKSNLLKITKMYNVLSRRKGQWFTLGKGLSKSQAEELGVKYTQKTLARSFQLKPSGEGLSLDIDTGFKIPKKLYRSPIGRSKLPRDTYIERNALGTRSAVTEILQAKKSKSKMFGGKIKIL